MGYNFSMYLHGPYSSDLADDYYELAKDEVMTELIFEEEGYLVSSLRGSDLNGFDQSSFFAFVNGRDHEWLETATTLLSLSRHITNRRGLVERAANMKEHIPVGTIESILGTLERNGLLPSLSSG